MIRLPRIRPALAMLAGLVLLVTAAPATAAGPKPPTRPPWLSAPCATGAFTQATAYDGDGSVEVRFDGWIQPCAGAAPGSSYALMLYTAEGHRGRLQSYDPSGVPVTFTGILRYERYEAYGTPHAVVVPIPTNDPRVTVPVDTANGLPGDPNCGTCL